MLCQKKKEKNHIYWPYKQRFYSASQCCSCFYVIMQNMSARILEIKIHVISLQIKAHFTCILENVSTMNNWWPLVAHQRPYCELWASCWKLAHCQALLACQWVLRGSQSNCMTWQTARKTWVWSGPEVSTSIKRATEETSWVLLLYLQHISCCSICSQCEVI